MTQRYFRPELDWLRFVAFCAVFVFHGFPADFGSYVALGLPPVVSLLLAGSVPLGTHGVDLFFVLSAFLITTLLLQERDRTGQIHIRAFYVRRILRIWPLYFVYIAIAAPYDFVYNDAPALYYAGLLTFIGNWYQSLPLRPLGFSLAGHLWSICVEEQFYIVWPVLMKARKRLTIACILFGLMGLAYALRLIMFSYGADLFSFCWNTITRLDPFILGGLLALAMHNRTFALHLKWRCAAAGLSAILFVATGLYLVGHTDGTPILFLYPSVALACTLLVLAAIGGPPMESGNAILRLWSYLGKISYGLYIFHLPSLVIADSVALGIPVADPWIWVVRFAIASVLTLVLSMASYRYLEKPFLRMKHRFTYVESRPE